MHVVDLIRKKRDGGVMTDAEIAALVAGAATNSIPEYQLAAWLMAVCWRGLNAGELHSLTTHMRDSGKVMNFRSLPGNKVDKHSTGGVGDKTSFLVAPIAAAAGLCVPMISGRALGHTGGTLDKLESIPGYRTHLQEDEIRAVLTACGLSIVGQTEWLVPADRTLYSLRDRTATVESPFLICASIMSKKLAAGLDALVLDVKTGSGAFLKQEAEGHPTGRANGGHGKPRRNTDRRPHHQHESTARAHGRQCSRDCRSSGTAAQPSPPAHRGSEAALSATRRMDAVPGRESVGPGRRRAAGGGAVAKRPAAGQIRLHDRGTGR